MTNFLLLVACLFLAGVITLFTRATDQNRFEENIAMTTQAAVDQIVTQLGKAKSEIIAKLTDLQGQLDAAGVAEQVDLGPLTAIAQSLDDIVPDPAPVVDDPAPAEEPASADAE